jgi:hypothetical protein
VWLLLGAGRFVIHELRPGASTRRKYFGALLVGFFEGKKLNSSESRPRPCIGLALVRLPPFQPNLHSGQGLSALEACGLNVLVQDLLEQVMHGHIVLLAAFFVESQPPAYAVASKP